MHNKALHTDPLRILHTYTLCSFCGWELNTNRGTVWCVISLASVGYGDSYETDNICCSCTWSSNQSAICFFQLPQSSSSPQGAQCVYLAPDEDNRIHCWVLLDPECGKTVLLSIWMYIDPSNKCWLYNLNCRCNSFFSCVPHYEFSGVVAVLSAGGESVLDSM